MKNNPNKITKKKKKRNRIEIEYEEIDELNTPPIPK